MAEPIDPAKLIHHLDQVGEVVKPLAALFEVLDQRAANMSPEARAAFLAYVVATFLMPNPVAQILALFQPPPDDDT